jgi:hypothetical protein
MPDWMKRTYQDTYNANLGTNIGSGIGADYVSRGMLQANQDYQNYYLMYNALTDVGQLPQVNIYPDLAKSWEIYEEAFFCVNEDASIPQVGRLDAEGIVKFLQRAKKEAGSFEVILRQVSLELFLVELASGEERVRVRRIDSQNDAQVVDRLGRLAHLFINVAPE